MKITHIPIDEETRQVDIKAMRRAINGNTCMVSQIPTTLLLHFWWRVTLLEGDYCINMIK